MGTSQRLWNSQIANAAVPDAAEGVVTNCPQRAHPNLAEELKASRAAWIQTLVFGVRRGYLRAELTETH
jgi:hypothetical protein